MFPLLYDALEEGAITLGLEPHEAFDKPIETHAGKRMRTVVKNPDARVSDDGNEERAF